MEDTQSSSVKDSLVKNENQNKNFITFAKINKYFLIPFLCPVFCMISNYFLLLLGDTKVIINSKFFIPVYVEFTYAAAGLLYYISYFKDKINEVKEDIIYREERPSNSIKYIYNEGYKKTSLKEWILIITLGFLISLFEILSACSESDNLFEERLYFLFFIPLFSKFILKDDIFKHQYLSLIIAVVGLVLLFIPVCTRIQKEDILPNVLQFLAGIAYSLFLVLIKHITHVYYISPFQLSLFFGLISVGFTAVGFFLYSLITYHDLSFFKDTLDFSDSDRNLPGILLLIGCFITATTFQVLTLLVIFYFSPILLMVTDIISPMLLWVAVIYKEEKELIEYILFPIGYVIVLFSALIYNEIIIFNFCDLGKDTKKFVEQRLTEESTDIRKTENDLKIGSFARSDEGSNDDGENEDRMSDSL